MIGRVSSAFFSSYRRRTRTNTRRGVSRGDVTISRAFPVQNTIVIVCSPDTPQARQVCDGVQTVGAGDPSVDVAWDDAKSEPARRFICATHRRRRERGRQTEFNSVCDNTVWRYRAIVATVYGVHLKTRRRRCRSRATCTSRPVFE